MSDDALSNMLHEERRFPPPPELAAQANVTAATYAAADADLEAFWREQAGRLSWQTEPTQVLDWSNPPFATWYADGTLNAAYNCLDRHVEAGRGDRVAFHFEGEPGDTRTITYADLAAEVRQAANALVELGVKAGNRVAIYLPMIPHGKPIGMDTRPGFRSGNQAKSMPGTREVGVPDVTGEKTTSRTAASRPP